jgi:hypothetical protein
MRVVESPTGGTAGDTWGEPRRALAGDSWLERFDVVVGGVAMPWGTIVLHCSVASAEGRLRVTLWLQASSKEDAWELGADSVSDMGTCVISDGGKDIDVRARIAPGAVASNPLSRDPDATCLSLEKVERNDGRDDRRLEMLRNGGPERTRSPTRGEMR